MNLLVESKPSNSELCIVLEKLIKNWETKTDQLRGQIIGIVKD